MIIVDDDDDDDDDDDNMNNDLYWLYRSPIEQAILAATFEGFCLTRYRCSVCSVCLSSGLSLSTIATRLWAIFCEILYKYISQIIWIHKYPDHTSHEITAQSQLGMVLGSRCHM